jgi:gas vesicle protein
MWELGRILVDWKNSIAREWDSVVENIETYVYELEESYENKIQELEDKIEELENNK